MGRYEYMHDGELIEAQAERRDRNVHIEIGDREFEVRSLGNNLFSVVMDGRRRVVAAVEHKGVYYLDINSVQIEITEPGDDGPGGAMGAHEAEKDKVFAPMPGKVVKVLVKEGDTVAEKQQLIIVEAMKMENPVLAKAAGTVKSINFAEGDQVDTVAPLIELDIDEDA